MSKNVVVFSDGTGNSTERHASNILRLCWMVDASNRARQRVVYDPGVGTFTTTADLREALEKNKGVMFVQDSARDSRSLTLPKALLGLGFGLGTEENVWQLYRTLAAARTYWRIRANGPRVVRDGERGRQVAIHDSARSCYREGEPPWAGLEVRFTTTVEHRAPVAAITCRCGST